MPYLDSKKTSEVRIYDPVRCCYACDTHYLRSTYPWIYLLTFTAASLAFAIIEKCYIDIYCTEVGDFSKITT